MTDSVSPAKAHNEESRHGSFLTRHAVVFVSLATGITLLGALALPKGFPLAVFGDTLQFVLLLATSVLAFRNFLRSHSRSRIFWFLTFIGVAIWTLSDAVWNFYELWLCRPVPDAPASDSLLFLKIVPLTIAFAAAPHRERSSHFRPFGLLDVSVMMVYALYLYVFGVFSYRLVPGAIEAYNFRFDVADAIANHILLIGAAIALLTARGHWKTLYRFYFVAAVSYALASNLIDVAIDRGRYYTGGFYDVPLVAAHAALLCAALLGSKPETDQVAGRTSLEADELPTRGSFLSSHLAMLVMLSTPLIGLWLLSGNTTPALVHFRLTITLFTMLLLTILLSIKQDLLNAGLIRSLAHLSGTYRSIERFKSQLSQSETLASLGELVAAVANQIKRCMVAILEVAARLACRPDTESRVRAMAGKIGQYAQRTDALVDNMLHFAQETPTRPALLRVRPLLESALQLSRVAKLPNIKVALMDEGECPTVMADSSQLLHVFLELISNAVDALQDVHGGSLDIRISRSDLHLCIDFQDSGPGLNEPARVFEPFYTTKPVGKGTGLGLSTCYGIMQQHHGEITCRNRLTGGTCFTIRLPLAPEERTEPGAPATAVLDGAV